MKGPSLLLFTTVLMVGCGEGRFVAPAAPTPIALVAPARGSFTLSGLVTAITSAGSQPLQGARIRVDTASGALTATTDERGYYAINGLPAESCTVVVEKEGYETVEASLGLSQDSVMNFELRARN